MPQLKLTPYQRLVRDWSKCTRCPLHKVRKKVVIAKGKIPAEVLFIGEAPGESEDVIGDPFVGPAGQLLDEITLAALEDGIESLYGPGPAPTIAWTNLVGCIPKDANTMRKAAEPLPEEIEACYPRLEELIRICAPKLIVCVGLLVGKYSRLREGPAVRSQFVTIDHPAYLIRLDITRYGLERQRNIVKLASAFTTMVERR